MDKPIVRETYLDVIKGLAMLLVVMQHVGGALNEGLSFLCKVDVPLFFVVSGYLASKPNIQARKELIKKTKRIAVPFVLALLFATFWYKQDIQDTLFDIGKCGYWFLFCLFCFFCMFYTFNKILQHKMLFAISFVIELSLLALSKFGPEMLDNILGISYMSRYFPCFIGGVFIKQYGIKNIGKAMGCLLLAITCVAFTYRGLSTNISFLLHVVGYISSSIFAFYFIKYVENEMPDFVRNALSYIGKKSLAVYIIHFYFVAHLAQSTGYFVVDVFIVLIISLIVIALSILMERIFVKMTYLDKVL